MSDDYILQATGLGKSFRGFDAVRGVDLHVRRGSVHALIGPNGAGKTTCFNLLTRFLPVTTGRIVFDGRDITSLDPASVARMGLVRSFQISAVFRQLSVFDNLRVALLGHAGGSLAFWQHRRALDRFNRRAEELIAAVSLERWADRAAAELPYGRKRALELATTLALEPRLVLLDEPTSGLGHEDIAPVTRLIGEVARRCTVLMVEHNMKVVADLSDRITVLQAGEVLAEGPYEMVSRDPRVLEAYVGGAHV
jgi:branched-chain amino acid transport system ATP-binding protein